MQQKWKEYSGSGGALGTAKKNAGALRSLLLKRAKAASKLNKADKLRAQVHSAGEDVSEGSVAQAAQYLLNHTFSANGNKGVGLGKDEASWAEGSPVELMVPEEALKQINEHKGFHNGRLHHDVYLVYASREVGICVIGGAVQCSWSVVGYI